MTRVTIFQDIKQARDRISLGQKRLVLIGDLRVCLIHTAGGFKAIEDECPHLGYSLSKGTLNPAGEIICPWHSYRFSLESGEEAETRCRDVRRFALDTSDGGLSILLED